MSRHFFAYTLSLILLLPAAACDKGAGNKPSSTRDLAAGEGPSGAMTYFGKKVDVDCDDILVPRRAAGDPVDDVRGLRLGVPMETAVRFAQCPNGAETDSVVIEGDGPSLRRDQAGLNIRSFVRVASGQHRPRWGATNPLDYDPASRLRQVDAQWSFYGDGMPGNEKLYAIWLTQSFEKGSEPTIASQRAAIEAKYGKPTMVGDQGELFWLYQAGGKPLPEFDRQRLQNCRSSISVSGPQMNWSPECGLTIVARIDRAYDNPQLASAVHVALFDSATYYDYEVNRFPAERDALRAGGAAAARSAWR